MADCSLQSEALISTESEMVPNSVPGISCDIHCEDSNYDKNYNDTQLHSLIEESKKLKETIGSLEEKLKKEKLINRITDNDKMTKFYTGLKSWKLFLVMYKLLLPGIDHCSLSTKRSLQTEEQFLLVLMRLRLNLSEQDLAYRFHISQTSVSSYLAKWIDVMYIRLSRNFMVWPTREALRKSTPTYFRNKFPGCVSIIDAFEIPLERFNNLLARSSTFSFYKGRNTIKYLISVTPVGSISYISQGYGGRSTDVHITLDKKNVAVVDDENFLDKLQKDDVVLADRGFLVEEEVRKRGAKLITPAFLGRRTRLTRSEVNYSRKVSNVRIHVERVIGKLRQTFRILRDRVPVSLVGGDKDKISFFDKIVFVCCCLSNANPSVVPIR